MAVSDDDAVQDRTASPVPAHCHTVTLIDGNPLSLLSLSAKPHGKSSRRQRGWDAPKRTGAPKRVGVRDPLAAHGYSTLGPIASGAFSTVQRAIHRRSGREVAVKGFVKKRHSALTPGERALGRVSPVEDSVAKGTRELEVLRMLAPTAHPNVAHLVEVVESARAIHAVLEYCAGGSLALLLNSRGAGFGLEEGEAAALFAQANGAVAHLHRMGVAHRDVKPANLLFVDGERRHIKLCDFGFAARCTAVSAVPPEVRERRLLRTLCGTPFYQAPELRTQSVNGYEGPPVDMWALGAVLYEMLHGRPAFHGETMEVLQLRISKASHARLAAALSTSAKALVRALLQINPATRLGAHAVATDGWLSQHAPTPAPPPLSPPPVRTVSRPAGGGP
eukprot:Transcript_6664.p1 GENE.Transcript_6664~~Transcript_6664.p1  ORF type:complete len:391 (+),score=139.61 Transcript_6664:279-1451(+)